MFVFWLRFCGSQCFSEHCHKYTSKFLKGGASTPSFLGLYIFYPCKVISFFPNRGENMVGSLARQVCVATYPNTEINQTIVKPPCINQRMRHGRPCRFSPIIIDRLADYPLGQLGRSNKYLLQNKKPRLKFIDFSCAVFYAVLF